MAAFDPLSPPDGVVFSATRPAVFVFTGGNPLTTADVKVNDAIVATTAALVVTQISNAFTVTATQPGGGGETVYYTVTPETGWPVSPTTVEVDGIFVIPYSQTRTLLIGEGYTSDHTATALDRMLEQFQGSVNLRLLASSYVDQVQTLENTAIQLLHDRSLDTGTGHRLDGLGQLVGITRSGEDDEAFRLRIRGELAVLNSQGSLENLIAIMRLLLELPDSVDIQINEYFPKAIYMRPRDFIFTGDPDLIAALLRRAVSAATYIQFVYTSTEADDDDLFRFSDTNGSSEFASSHGYSNGTFAGAR